MTILLYTRRKDWPLRSVEVESGHRRVHRSDYENYETDARAFVDEIKVRILIEGDLNEEQVERVRYIAGRCPVTRTLEAKPVILHEVEVVG
jgi:putative redox protein